MAKTAEQKQKTPPVGEKPAKRKLTRAEAMRQVPTEPKTKKA